MDTTMSKTKRNCGFIGLGHLGVYLAASLLRAGHNVTINDLNKSLGEGLIAKGAKWANSAKEVAQASEVVFHHRGQLMQWLTVKMEFSVV
jgi:3-hydroxyisobutyrate dehydrogenase-like beta-hydroxyacid dehydrogenase